MSKKSDKPKKSAKSSGAKSLAKKPYRLGAGIVLFNRAGQVFTGLRIDTTGHEAWQMPQGGIDKGEDPHAAALRELEEETGIPPTLVRTAGETRGWVSYDLPADIQKRVWKGRYRGQRQKWYAMRFLGCDADVDINTPKPEFCDWTWTDPARLPERIIAFKQALYRDVLADLMPVIRVNTRP